jgi:hypothetical protein
MNNGIPTADNLVFPRPIDPSNISITNTTTVMDQGDFQKIVLEVSISIRVGPLVQMRSSYLSTLTLWQRFRDMQERLGGLEQLLKQLIAEQKASLAEGKLSTSFDSKDNKADEKVDRTRLKERLRKSMSLQINVHSANEKRRIFWLDYIFGICAPDQRAGIEGSRSFFASIHQL